MAKLTYLPNNVGYLLFQQLIDNLDRDLQYAIKVEGKMDMDLVSNYDEVKTAIKEKVPAVFPVKLIFWHY